MVCCVLCLSQVRRDLCNPYLPACICIYLYLYLRAVVEAEAVSEFGTSQRFFPCLPAAASYLPLAIN